MKKSIFAIALGLGIQLLTACGSDQQAEHAETQSLTGGFNGGPCGFYGKNLNSSNFYCATIRSGIPLNVLFELQALDQSQVNLIRSALDVAIARYNDYWDEVRANPNGTPRLLQCAMKNTKQDLKPVNSRLVGSFSTEQQFYSWAPVSLQFGFQFHQKNAVPAIIRGVDIRQNAVQKEGNFYTVAQALLGNDDTNGANMDIEVNRLAIGRFSVNTLAGTLVHEWLHRRGFDHTNASSNNPQGYEEGRSLVTVVGDCITTNNNLSPGASLTSGFGPKVGGG